MTRMDGSRQEPASIHDAYGRASQELWRGVAWVDAARAGRRCRASASEAAGLSRRAASSSASYALLQVTGQKAKVQHAGAQDVVGILRNKRWNVLQPRRQRRIWSAMPPKPESKRVERLHLQPLSTIGARGSSERSPELVQATAALRAMVSALRQLKLVTPATTEARVRDQILVTGLRRGGLPNLNDPTTDTPAKGHPLRLLLGPCHHRSRPPTVPGFSSVVRAPASATSVAKPELGSLAARKLVRAMLIRSTRASKFLMSARAWGRAFSAASKSFIVLPACLPTVPGFSCAGPSQREDGVCCKPELCRSRRSRSVAQSVEIQYRRVVLSRAASAMTFSSWPPFFSIVRIEPMLSSAQVTSARRIPRS
jgi:hypothetical protein